MESPAVNCAECGHSNPAGQKFCGECGTKLPAGCPSCGHVNPAGQKFCGNCGSALTAASAVADSPTPPLTSTAASAPPQELPPSNPSRTQAATATLQATSTRQHEERRIVTALFCDLVGFTPMSEQLDPEEVRDIQGHYFDAMKGQIERYGGTVQKYAGDAVLAFFGVPAAHEDDAERAVLCALGMQEAIEPVASRAKEQWDIQPSIRIGVNTGEVVSGVWEVAGRVDMDVTGDAINTAARIQTAAEPGEVLVGAETMRLTRRRIQYGDGRDVTLKGKVGPVTVYRAQGLREHFGERWEISQTAVPLLGRDRELLDLLDAWVRSQGGEGQLVTLVGDVGVGKSRLMAELIEKVGSSSAVRVARGRCLSYGQDVSLWLVADLLRSLFGIAEQDDLGEVAAKLQGTLRGLIGSGGDDVLSEALDVLGEILGMEPGNSPIARAGAQVRRQALIRSLKLLFRALSDRAPLLVVLEDLHWIDEASQEVLTAILPDVASLRILVLAAQRPGWSAPWSEWGWTERLTLRPLRDEDATKLAGAVLGDVELSTELERYVTERAGGNPFFVEEMLRALSEAGGLVAEKDGRMTLVRGVADKLPVTLTEVLLARLDRLEASVRNVAQVGSVIGRSFGVRLLGEIVGEDISLLEGRLNELHRAEVVFPSREVDLEYVFKHVSMRDAAYNTLVQKRRQELHLKAALAIAALYPADEYIEIIAYHFGQTEDHPSAAEWLERAGDRAAAALAFETAIEDYREASRHLQLAAGDPLLLGRVQQKLGVALRDSGRYPEALPPLEQAVDIFREKRDMEAAGRGTADIGIAHRLAGTPQEGIRRVEPMLELLDWSGPSAGLAELQLSLAQLYFLSGRYRDGIEVAAKAEDIARALGDDRILAYALERKGVLLNMTGSVPEAVDPLQKAVDLSRQTGDILLLRRALSNLSHAKQSLGDLDASRQLMESSIEVCERIGDPSFTSFNLGNFGSLLTDIGQWGESRMQLERALELGRSGTTKGALTNALSELGRLCILEGDFDGAKRYLNEGLEIATKADDRQLAEAVQSMLGELEVRLGSFAAAIDRLTPLVDEEDALFGLLLPPLITALVAEGKVDEGHRRSQQLMAHTRASDHYHVVEGLRTQASVLRAQGERGEALRSSQEGLELARTLPRPYEEARILILQGEMAAEESNQDEARERFNEALAIFKTLGAKWDVTRTEGKLEELAASREPQAAG